ncbi:MAG: OmcA/MtrC family decaheme c-type cytochrome, partial [Bryobacteraceae bacterium]
MAQSRIPFVTVLVLLAMVPLSGLTAADKANKKTGFTGQLAAKHLDENQLSFIRPGITVKLVSAAVASDGTITARVTISDPKGLPLDKDGITTPGSVTLRFIAATIPAAKTQYTSYTTTLAKSTTNSNPSQTQAATDSGGTFTKNADGDYTYTFKTKAPVGFDATATHAIGVSAQRDLSEFMTYDEWSETSNDVLNFVPNGAPVTVTRSITPTAACNKCHDPLFGHGGSRLTVEMCILCHSPQTINPDTGLTQDMPVLIHKIHMGENLPSVKAGTPYRIWHRGAWSDFSTVAFPQDVRNCTVCHASGAPQADNWKTNPSRAVCGSCHDNVNFATGENHVDLPMLSDNECKNCHTSQQTMDFDASIPGAHVVPNNSTSLPGVVSKVLKVENAVPGSAPVITFSLTDKAGNPLDVTKLTQVRAIIAGPNVDYQTGEAGLNVRETITTAPGSGGVYTYTATNKIPAGATGSYTVSIQARNTVLLLPGTKKETSATDSANPTQFYFSVDSSPVAARRVVVSTEKCAACHDDLKFVHGGTRNDTQACTICHNPTLTDGTSKQSVNFAWQIHSTHRSEGLANPYVLGTTNYQEVRFPGDVRDCSMCHVGNSYQPDNIGAVAPVASTGGFTATTMPIAAACQGCHDDVTTASHALNNT